MSYQLYLLEGIARIIKLDIYIVILLIYLLMKIRHVERLY